jgi:hypothetical protein
MITNQSILGMEITLPQMDEFANAPGPRYTVRANNADITLREYDPLFGPVDLTYEDQVFEPEFEEDLDQLLNQEIDRMSRPNSAVPDLENQERLLADLRNMGNESSLLEEARDASLNIAESRLHEMPRSEVKNATAAEAMSQLRTSMDAFVPFANEEPMEFDSFAVPDDIVGGVVPGKLNIIILTITYLL